MDDGLNQNYKSNDESVSFSSNLAAKSNLDLQIGHLEGIVPLAPTDLDIDDVDIDLDDEKREEGQKVSAFDFFAKDLIPDEPKEESLVDFSKIAMESKSENRELDDMKNIFDQIDQIEQLSSDGEDEKFEVHDLSKSQHFDGI